MALIKHAESDTIARDAVVLDLGDLQRQGDELRARAERDAAAIIENAEKEAERLITDAKNQGYGDGHSTGLEEGRRAGFEAGRNGAFEEQCASLQKIVSAWTDALESFIERRDAMLRDARADVVRLAVRLGERVLKREIRHDKESAARQLEAALDLVLEPTALRIELNPADRDAVSEALPGLLARFAPTAHAEIVDSPTIERGGCRLRTDAGMIDAGITSQIRRVADELLASNSKERWENAPDEADESA